ncbi:hypothetical protein [Paenibacillus sp.]|uniref:hypothetical protein n=1 Tax=Paenibacillus sp. TaxID=58172 RepID=UPI00283A8F82|nr:hypothetical protein [Paenibacillus sp.]
MDYKLAFTPKKCWNKKIKEFSYDAKDGYAVIEKVVSGKSYSWKLIKYSGEGQLLPINK